MRKNVLVIAIFVTLFGLSLVTPLADFESYSRQSLEQDQFTISGIGDNTEDYVDQLSNLHAPTDIGTHNVFTDLQADDTNYDSLTEVNQGSAGNNVQDTVDSDATDIDSSPDVGTQGTFANAQDLGDSNYMTLQEADAGGAGINENLSIDAVTTPAWTTVGTTPYLDAQDQPTNYIHTVINGLWTGWFTFADTSGTSGTFSVNCSVYHDAAQDSTFAWEIDWTGDSVADASGGPVTYRATWGWTSLGTIAGLDTVTEINAAQIRFFYDKGGAGPDQQSIDAARLGVFQAAATDYELDFEYQFTSVDFDETNEEVCINVQTATQGTEELVAYEWDGVSAWALLGTLTTNGWNNFTASYITSSTYYIEIRDNERTDEGTQSTWLIDSIILHVWTVPAFDYELDLEVGWTAADFDETNEELCIFPVTGGGWPTEDIKVDVWNGAWTNVIADLTPDQWNNVSIGSYLSDATFEIRFLGGTETGDSTQDTWEIDAVLIHTWTPSYTPVIDQTPTLDNPSDTDYMYAQYLEYQVTAYVSDLNGFDDITYLEVGIWDNARSTEYFRFRYDEDTNSFTEEYDGGTYVTLNTGSSTAIESGNDIDATFYFTVDWDFPDVLDLDANCTVVDAQSESSETWYEVGWNVETRLEYSVTPIIDDGSGTADRGDLDGSFSLTGTVIYYNSVDDFPASTAVDVWVSGSEYGTSVGPWSDTTLSSGAFDVTCYADDLVGVTADTYTVKVVEEGVGSGGTDLYYTTSVTDTYIADQLVITISDPTDQRIDIGANATGIFVSAIYDFDDSPFDGTLTLNDTTFDYGTVGRRGYTVSTASGGAHGVSLIGVNDVTYCIWDSLTVTITDPSDQHVNTNTNASGIVVSAVYDYDGTAFDGTFTLNNTQFTYATAQIQGYTVQSVSGGAHGITTISTNDATYCIWDSLTITITDPADQRQNINTNATGIFVSAVYDFDGSAFDGTLTLNNTQFLYGTAQRQGYTVSSASDGTHGITVISSNDATFFIWDSLTITIVDPSDQRININSNATGILVSAIYDYDSTPFDGTLTLNNTQYTYPAAQIQGYTVQTASGGTHGIDTISVNDETYCIWDSLTITLTDPTDQRIDINTNASGIFVSAVYDYDGSVFDGTLTLNNTQFNYATAQIQGYTVDLVSGGAHGITAISVNDATYCIWDSLTITVTDPADQRININSNATGIFVSAVYDYDGSVFDGTLTLNNTQFTYGTAQRQGYTVQSVSGGTHGITTILVNDATYCIWDSLTITMTDPPDQRININTNASGIIVSAIYDYDGTAFDGTFTLNNTQFSYATAQIQGYTIDSVSGGVHGITTILVNDATYCVWDSLTITLTDPTDQHININTNASGIVVSIIYDYDGSSFDGTFTLNNTQFSYTTAQIQGYTVDSVSGSAHGISTISVNDVTYCIWDSLTITITDPADQRIDINTNATGIFVSAIYDYDGSTFDGTLTLNNTQFTYATAQIQGYTVDSVSGGAHGITAISVNDATWCIWDSLTITITDPGDQRININSNATGIIVSAVYDYDGSSFDGTLTLNNTQFSYATAQRQGYTVDSASGGVHGITAISVNDATYCIWDSLTLTITDPGDQRINVNTNATGIFVSAVYDYDGSAFDGTLTLNNTQFTYATPQIQWYSLQSVSGGAHGIDTLSNSDNTWCIWDSLTITLTDPSDQRINVGFNASGIIVSAIYDYDGASFDGTLTLNNTLFSYATVQIQGYTVGSVSGDTHGITVIATNDETWCIWDQIIVRGYSVLDNRVNVDDSVDINVTVEYDFDDTPVTDGTLTISGIFASHVESGIWRITDTESVVRQNLYQSVQCASNFHGIWDENQDFQSQIVIWDQIQIFTTTTDDGRIDFGTQATIAVTARLEFDLHPLGSGDTLYLYDTQMTWNGSHFILNPQFSQVGKWTFFVNSSNANEVTYGISSVNLFNKEVDQIWDRIQILTTVATDGRVSYGLESTTINVTAQLEYDSHMLTSGDTLYLNGVQMTWDTDHFYTVVGPFVVVDSLTFYVNASSANELNYGITSVDIDGNTADVIWDRLLITISVDDSTPLNGVQANFSLSIEYDYNGENYTNYQIVIYRNATWWRSFTDSNWSLFVETYSDMAYTYTVQLVTSATYGILAFSTNSQQVIWSALPNSAPANDAEPLLTNPDDGFMLAMYNFYIITSNTSDGDGFNNIQYVELTLYDNTSTTPIWSVRYTVIGDSFSITLGSAYIELGVSSFATGSGNDLDITWYIKIDWDHVDMANMVPHQFVTDGVLSDSDFSFTLWDVETRLDYSSAPSLSDDHGDIGTSDLVATGTVVYLGSTTSPLASETDVWIIHDLSGTWNGDLVAGSFSITNIGSSASVRLNTYTVKVVLEGTGSGGTDLYYTTSVTDTFITDRIEVYEVGVVDGRININSNCEVWWRARYEYSLADIQSGLTLLLNGSRTLVWDAGNLYWRWQETSITPSSAGFDVVSGSESTYGLTALLVTTSEQQVIWDAIIITLTEPSDQRINTGTNATGVHVSAVYAYDGTAFDGSITLNNTQFVYVTAQIQYYTIDSVSGGAHGITTISSNDVTWCIWDSLTITLTDPVDQRQNINTNATGIFVSVTYDFDGSSFDGTYTLNNTQFTYGTAQRQGYTIDSVSGGAYGITVISTNDVTYFIWDSLTITVTDPTDQHININTNASGILVSVVYDYDGTTFDGTFSLNNTQFTYATAQVQGYTVDSVSGGAHGITTISVNDETYCIWDSLTITVTDPIDQRININTNATGILVSVVYDYDGSAFDGTFSLNNTQFSYATAQRQGYTVDSVDGGAHGITTISSNDVTYCIWDSLTITLTDPANQRQNVNVNATGIFVIVIYDYDGTAFDGTFTLNNTQFTYATAQRQGYIVDSVSGGAHGITTISSNDVTYFIWDSLTITITDPADQHINVNTNATGIFVSAVYDYDGTAFDGTLILNNTQFNYATAQRQGYTVDSVSGGAHGITAISVNDATWCIWDSLTITITDPADQRININTNATGIFVSAVYDYDGFPFDGTLSLNNTQFTYATAQIQGYTVDSVSGGTHEISAISLNDATWCIWDQLDIVIGVDDASPIDGQQANFTLTVRYVYDNVVCTTYQISIDRNSTLWNSFTDATKHLFVDTNTDTTYFYNASLVSSESNYGITSFTTTTLKVTWSLAPNEIPVNDSSPVLTNGDDTDYLYARYRFYVITTSASDPDGYGDIDYVELTLYSDDQITTYWTVRYTFGTDTFSVESGIPVVVVGAMSNAVGVDDTLTITWHIKIGWDHADIVDSDTRQIVSDGTDTASDFYETNWNVETRLDYSVAPSLSDNHGDIGTADLVATGSVTFANSSHSPLSNETDVWVLHDLVGTWTGDLTAGSFSISNIGSAAVVRLNTYTVKIVAEGDGSGGTDLYYTTSPTDTFITDGIEIYLAGVVGDRIDINSDCEVWWRARYLYGGAEIQSGLTITLNGSRTLVWDAGGLYWRWQETSVAPASAGFEVASASESTFGLTYWVNITSVQQVIWDSLIITMTDPVYQRIDVGTNATGILVSAVYAFDGAAFDGTLTLNNTNFQYTVPQMQGYTVLSVSGDTFGITAIQTNDATFCIWDRVLVVSVSADELYHDPDDDVMVTVELQYEYDGSSVLAGTFAIASYPLTHTGSGVWEAQVTISTYQAIDFDDLTTCDATDYGISEYNMDSYAVTVYWDRLEFYSVSVDDNRINVGVSAEVQWGVRLETAGISITAGVTAQMTGSIALTPAAGVFSATVTESAVGSVTYSILTASLGEIGLFIQSASDATVIWDQVLVTSIIATPLSTDTNTATEIRVTLIYEFDSSAVTTGVVNLEDGSASVPMSYNSVGGYWSVSITKSTAGNYTFTVDSVSANTHGITTLDTDSLSVEVEWVGAPGFVLDTMTLMVIGGGAGIGVLGLAIVASRRRKGGVVADLTALEPGDFGVAEPVEVESPVEPEIVEPEVEAIPEEIEPEVVEEPEVSEPDVEVVDEVVEPEEAELPPMDEDLSGTEVEDAAIEPEVEVIEEVPEPEEIESLVEEELAIEPEVIEEPIIEPEAEPEVVDYDDIPDEFVEPEAPVDLSSLTKKELLGMIPEDIRATTSPKEIKRLTKQELISLIESFKD